MFHWWNSYRCKELSRRSFYCSIGEMHLIIKTWTFPMAIGLVGVHSTRPLLQLVRLVPMQLRLFEGCSIGEMFIIIKTSHMLDCSRLSRVVFYSSIGTNGTIGTNGNALLRLVFHWGNAYHYKEMHLGLLALRTKNLHWVGVDSTCPLLQMVRLVTMQLHLFEWCSIG